MLRRRISAGSILQLARDAVQQPLHGEHRLRPAGAAHHRGRHPVGERDRGLHAVGRHDIGAGERRRRDIGHDDAPRQERAGVVQHGAAQAENLSLRVDGDRDLPVLVAFLRRGEEMLAPVLLPFHGTAELHRRCRNHRLLGVERRLGAEAAADERRDHADRFEIALEQIGERAAAEMRRLRRRPHGEHVGTSIVAREHRAAFERHGAAAMHEHLVLEHMRGVLEGRIDVAIGSWARTAATLVAMPLCTRGAPGFTASRQSLTAGSSS